MKSERINLIVPSWLKLAMVDVAKSKGISMSELIKDAMKKVVEDYEKSSSK
jgi:hypothetical protein